ncbi:MAG: nucleoside diphosphate kinase regulator [Bdellovibrionales bacterium]|nr:nucleoside diphosphate kinase regulator [Bdellovibrionales bacterium]
MTKSPSLIISQDDFNAITSLLSQADADLAHLLEEELSRATVVAASDLPADRVSMHSQVTFEDMDTKNKTIIRLVYPHETNSDNHCISILAPIGAALIGLRVGQEIQWPVPNGKSRLVKVTSVFQSELSKKV